MWHDEEDEYRYEKRWIKLEFEIEREIYLDDFNSEEEFNQYLEDGANWLDYLLEGRYNCSDDPKYWTVERV